MTLIDLLKIATGRKLSKKQIEEAKESIPTTVPRVINPDRHYGAFTSYCVDNDKIFKRTGSYSRRENSFWHTSTFVADKIEMRTYDLDGLLEEISTYYYSNNPARDKVKIVTYNPPGCWFGNKKVEDKETI